MFTNRRERVRQPYMQWQVWQHPGERWSDWMTPIEATEWDIWVNQDIRSNIKWIK